MLWLVLWGLSIEYEFGLVYFIVSMFYWLYFSMTIKSTDDKSPSAYSVFNKNYERIDGTFTAEQFEKQMKHGFM